MVKNSMKKYKILLNINNAIINQRSREGLFREITRVLNNYFNFDHISILVKKRDDDGFLTFFSPYLGVHVPELPYNEMPKEMALTAQQAMDTRQIITVNLMDGTDIPEADFLRKAGLYGVVFIPLVIWSRPIGSMQLCFKKLPEYDDYTLELFEMAAQQIAIAVENMLAYEELQELKDRLSEERVYLKKEISSLLDSDRVVFASPKMADIMDSVRNVASTDATVLITGETGTGKDIIAASIHRLSSRKNNTFVRLNCAALVPTLVESELFGHEKGAFTGANARKIGRFELAHSSTLFLDEITELSLPIQAKLLQVLQEHTFERVGGTETIKTDVRIVAATNQDILKLVSENSFRQDLYYRLNIFPIHIPPLRQRQEDIPVLGRYFGDRFCEKLGRIRPQFTSDAEDVLMNYSWFGNVRELQNFIERVIILKSKQVVTGRDIKSLLNVASVQEQNSTKLLEVERKHIESVLKQTRGVIAGHYGAAKLLGLKRSTLQYRMNKLGIAAADFK